ncbi:MAG: glycosyltransferase [Acidimicrobiales bacterium]|nr:glycosyltransferase [Acidimicrobiales bacterium]
MPRADVVVITWNDAATMLRTAIDSALAQPEVAQVIVVDNGSVPAAAVPDDPRIRLIVNEENRGVAVARNQGARAGTAEIVVLLDSDARLHDGALAALLAPFADYGVGMSVPRFVGQTPEASAGAAPTLPRKVARVAGLTSEYKRTRPRSTESWWDVDFGIGACQVFRRAAFDAVGGIDETFFYGPEDVDFCLRIGAAGWRVVQLADEVCDHPPRRRNRSLFTRRGFAHVRAVARYLWRHRARTP